MSGIRTKIYQYLAPSCGNGGIPTDHTISCLVGMIETGEAHWDDAVEVGGEHVVFRMIHLMMENAR